MRSGDRFDGLSVFLAVARRRSFRQAAMDLGLTAGAVSQAVRGLEERVGLPLFQRTTRRVALTEAGEAFLARVEPATDTIDQALSALESFHAVPSGTLRLTVPHLAASLFLEPVLGPFREAFPEVSVEISIDDAFVDLTADGFDAGIRLGESVGPDLIAVRLSDEVRWCIVGAPSYFARHGLPRRPHDLMRHTSIRYRYPRTQRLYEWELIEDGRELVLDVPGAITVRGSALIFPLARQGLGLAYAPVPLVAPDLASGRLVSVLDEFMPVSPGFSLYFTAGAQRQPKLRAFIDTLLLVLGRTPRPGRG